MVEKYFDTDITTANEAYEWLGMYPIFDDLVKMVKAALL
jgi:hypothetical protein